MNDVPLDITKYGNRSYVRAVLGTQFEDMPDYVGYLERAGEKIPETAAARGTHQPDGRPLAYKYYLDPKYVPEEVEKIWKKSWQVACRGEDIPNVGDRVAYDVGPLSFLIVRATETTFKAFWNSCRHRARRLCGDEPESGDVIQCPFHAWSYSLDGKLSWVPRQEEFPNLAAGVGLRPVLCDSWGGNVFINPDLNAAPLADALGIMPQHFLDCPQEDRYTAIRIKKKVRINWKSGLEAFLEGYHVLTTHPSGMPIFGSTYTQTDCWDDGTAAVSRLITPALVPDGWVKDEVSPRLALELFCNTYGLPAPPEGRGETVADARDYAAVKTAERYFEATGVDFRDRSISYLVDMHQWFSFPAFFPWWGEGLPWWYNFTPIDNSPDECIMEIRLLQPNPVEGAPPPVARTVWIDFDEKGRDYPETGQVGYIMDEDMENMEEVHRGMKATDPLVARPILATHQEIRIKHFHEAYIRAMGIKD
ncbi:aromatic ring-hydroxylating oxygenase subunit alpha [Flavisphingomonas formosensis]|uniref:aromatic ring-hydroxylating oxygenase subunit alpha n=1 Tax=Flavisphingomonas formosensis TaxID=861534 RepID=UPI0012FA7E3F|nr:aromatic ring-hydroxylating dioxygenase subunit alpha [Sphingomonas formosensis]